MRPSPKSIITSDKLVNLFSLFAIGTISFVLFLYLPKNITTSWWSGLLSGLNLLTFVTYEVVFLSICAHYITRGKNKLIEHFNQNKPKYYYGLVAVLGISIVIMAYFNTNKVINSVLYLVGLAFTVLTIPLQKTLMKLYNRWFGLKKK